MTAAATPGTQVEPRQKTKFEMFYAYLTTKEFVAQVAPFFGGSEMQAREFVRVVLNAVQKTPDLLYADRKSLLLSCMQAARDRLMPDGKKAVLTVYRSKEKQDGRDVWVDKVEYQPMSAGMIQKLYDSGHVTYADACAVYEKDVFEYERGDAPRIVHKPSPATDPGQIIASYLVAKLKSGETKREVMFRRDIDRVRESSKAPNSPAWSKWPDQMAIKAVIKRGYKQLPSSPDMDELIEHDNAVTGFSDFAADEMPEGGGTSTAVDKINAEVTGGSAKKETAAITHEKANTVPPMKVEPSGEPVQVETKKDAGEASKPVLDLEPVMSFEAVAAKINAAKTVDALNEARDLIRSVKDIAHREALVAHAAKREKEITADDGK